jgi:uncharacterized membrane protein YgcG
MKRHFLYCLFLLIGFHVPSYGQLREFSFSNESDFFFTDHDYDSLLNIYVREAAKSIGAPAENLDHAFESQQAEILQALIPKLEKDFLKIEKAFPKEPVKGSKAYNNQLELYRSSLKMAIRQIVREESGIREALKQADLNDRVLLYEQSIELQAEGTLNVVENIKIFNGKDDNLNNQIKRGITRDFPTCYFNQLGLLSRVPFQLKSVKRNGVKEPYHTEDLKNGIRIYLGSANDYLEEGIHQYRIEYSTSNQLIFHANKDELYWNVNGTGWNFSMNEVRCQIRFPKSCQILEKQCYTGSQGSAAQDCGFAQLSNHSINFYSRSKLEAHEGLTIAVAVEKGVFESISPTTKWFNLLKDNWIFTLGILSVLGTFIINFLLWLKVGKDPKKGVIIPQFEPPIGMSPADVGYALQQKNSPQLFSAAIIDMAVNGCMDIQVDEEGWIFKKPTYLFLKRNVDDPKHSRYYEQYGFDADDLDGQKAEKGSYNSKIAGAYTKLENQLKSRIEVEKKQKSLFAIFRRNDHYLGLSILFWVLFIIAAISWIAVYRTPWTFIVTISSIIFLGIIIQIIFAKIMSAYTVEGRKQVDYIEGFKRYLSTTEQSIYDKLNPPDENLQLFEKYLPYAVALDIDNQWAERFKNQIEIAEEQGYQPSYYRFHSSGNMSSSSFMSSFAGSLSSTVASASTPPSSSSGGSSGGGFSGGGGGGGGGGGW